MTQMFYPVELSNRNFELEVEKKAEETMDRLEMALRKILGEIPFTMQGVLTMRRIDSDGRCLQPLKVRVSVGPTTATRIDFGVVKGDYEVGMDFIPLALASWDIDRIAAKIAWDLRIALPNISPPSCLKRRKILL